MSTIKPAERKLLGWYAVRWAHITDWVKERSRRERRGGQQGQSVIASQPQQPAVDAPAKPAPEQISDTRAGDTTEGDKPHQEEEKLREAVQETHKTLATARSVFPFSLFPDIITIDQHKLTIIYRNFLVSSSR